VSLFCRAAKPHLWCRRNTGIKSFSFPCWMLRIVGQRVSTGSLMAAFSDCFPSSSCLLLREYWNLVPNNISVRIKKTNIWLPFKTWCSLSVPRCAAHHIRSWNSWWLYSANALSVHSENPRVSFLSLRRLKTDSLNQIKEPGSFGLPTRRCWFRKIIMLKHNLRTEEISHKN